MLLSTIRISPPDNASLLRTVFSNEDTRVPWIRADLLIVALLQSTSGLAAAVATCEPVAHVNPRGTYEHPE